MSEQDTRDEAPLNSLPLRSFLQVPFLNLLATVADRGGSVRIRVGGNTQETATLVDSLPDGAMIGKDKTVIGGSSRSVRNLICVTMDFTDCDRRPRRLRWSIPTSYCTCLQTYHPWSTQSGTLVFPSTILPISGFRSPKLLTPSLVIMSSGTKSVTSLISTHRKHGAYSISIHCIHQSMLLGTSADPRTTTHRTTSTSSELW